MVLNLTNRFVLFCWLGLVPAIAAAPVPATIQGQPGQFVVIGADVADGVSVGWYAPDAGLSLIPSSLLKDSRQAVALAPKPGRYRVVAFFAQDGQCDGPHVCVVVIGDPPKPEPAKPEPGPKPDDPLTAKLQAAYQSDPDPTTLAKLTDLYREASGTVIAQAEIQTAWDLKAVLISARESLGISDQLKPVRSLIALELAKILPTDPTAKLSELTKQRISAFFSALATRLEDIK